MDFNHPDSALSRFSSCIWKMEQKSRVRAPCFLCFKPYRSSDSPNHQLKFIGFAYVDGPAQLQTCMAFLCLLFTESSLMQQLSAAAFPSVLWVKSISLFGDNYISRSRSSI